jgi:ubiquitin C-terminal hydrolase
MEKDSSEVIYNGSLEIENHKYRLEGQVCHSGEWEGGKFFSYVSFKDRWFMAEDLTIKEVLKKDMLLGQPYIQLYKKVD